MTHFIAALQRIVPGLGETVLAVFRSPQLPPAVYFIRKGGDNYLIYATRDLNMNDYPNIYKHLVTYKDVINNRSPDRGEIQAALRIGKWWVLFVAKRREILESHKIVCPQRSETNCFAFNEGDFYASKDVYYITVKNQKFNLKYILAMLNSTLIFHWLYHKGKRKGNYLELYQRPLSEIPIKEISPNLQQAFVEYVDKILAITKDEDYPNNADKQARVKELERQIDQLVYELYGLTEEEIAVVEGRIN